MKILQCAFLLLCAGCASFSSKRLPAEEPRAPVSSIFLETQELAERLLARYPTDKYVYVGLGRSPTPLMAMLEVMRPGTTRNLPLSSVKAASIEIFQILADYPEAQGLKQALWQHFDKMLATESFRGLNILLVDFTTTGESLFEGGKLLDMWARERGHGEVSLLALAGSGEKAPPEGWARRYEAWPLMGNNIVGALLLNQSFDALAEYTSFPLASAAKPKFLKRRPSYDKLKSVFASYLQQQYTTPIALTRTYQVLNNIPADALNDAHDALMEARTKGAWWEVWESQLPYEAALGEVFREVREGQMITADFLYVIPWYMLCCSDNGKIPAADYFFLRIMAYKAELIAEKGERAWTTRQGPAMQRVFDVLQPYIDPRLLKMTQDFDEARAAQVCEAKVGY